MKFNLSDFLQLDTKGLLAVNGGYNCNGSTNNTVYPNTYYSGNGESPNGGGGTCPGKDGGTHIQPSDDGNGTGDDGTGGSGEGGCSPSNSPSNPEGSRNPENNKPGSDSDVGSGGGACSPTNSNAPDSNDPDTGNPDSSNPDNNISSGGGGCSASVSDSSHGHQVPDNPNDYHCDINSYNVAVDNGIQNPGNWDVNALGVNDIYTQNYADESTDTPQAGTRGYGFYDNDGDGSYDHMYFYDYRDGGDSYHVWNSNGIAPVSESNWSINGTAVEHSVYVPLN